MRHVPAAWLTSCSRSPSARLPASPSSSAASTWTLRTAGPPSSTSPRRAWCLRSACRSVGTPRPRPVPASGCCTESPRSPCRPRVRGALSATPGEPPVPAAPPAPANTRWVCPPTRVSRPIDLRAAPRSKSAGWLIDSCGLKGVAVGGARVSDLHANFIVNAASATSRDVRRLLRVRGRAATMQGTSPLSVDATARGGVAAVPVWVFQAAAQPGATQRHGPLAAAITALIGLIDFHANSLIPCAARGGGRLPQDWPALGQGGRGSALQPCAQGGGPVAMLV